jgi:nucleoside-diphosphate-sugar epimerase
MEFVNVHDVANAHVAIIERIDSLIDLCLVGTYYSWTPLLQIVNRLTGRKSF